MAGNLLRTSRRFLHCKQPVAGLLPLYQHIHRSTFPISNKFLPTLQARQQEPYFVLCLLPLHSSKVWTEQNVACRVKRHVWKTYSFCKPEIMASQADGLSSGRRGCSVSRTSVFTSRQKRSMSLLAICIACVTVELKLTCQFACNIVYKGPTKSSTSDYSW